MCSLTAVKISLCANCGLSLGDDDPLQKIDPKSKMCVVCNFAASQGSEKLEEMKRFAKLHYRRGESSGILEGMMDCH